LRLVRGGFNNFINPLSTWNNNNNKSDDDARMELARVRPERHCATMPTNLTSADCTVALLLVHHRRTLVLCDIGIGVHADHQIVAFALGLAKSVGMSIVHHVETSITPDANRLPRIRWSVGSGSGGGTAVGSLGTRLILWCLVSTSFKLAHCRWWGLVPREKTTNNKEITNYWQGAVKISKLPPREQ
jgi:hypothetical protein